VIFYNNFYEGGAVRICMGLNKMDWGLIEAISGNVFNMTAIFLRDGSCLVGRLGGMEEFLQSFENGEKAGKTWLE